MLLACLDEIERLVQSVVKAVGSWSSPWLTAWVKEELAVRQHNVLAMQPCNTGKSCFEPTIAFCASPFRNCSSVAATLSWTRRKAKPLRRGELVDESFTMEHYRLLGTCPECGADIGGEEHKVTSGNTQWSVGGTEAPAW